MQKKKDPSRLIVRKSLRYYPEDRSPNFDVDDTEYRVPDLGSSRFTVRAPESTGATRFKYFRGAPGVRSTLMQRPAGLSSSFGPYLGWLGIQ